MKTTFMKSSNVRPVSIGLSFIYVLELIVLFLLVFGTINLFAQSSEQANNGSNKLQLVKQNLVYNSGKVYLNWIVKGNSSDCVYVIERSIDGDEYEPIGLKEGVGSPIELLYSWIDNSPKEGASYYRLKQIDMDGKLVAQTDKMDMTTPENPLFIDKGSRLVQVK
jgi:hypothetical protein